jgi:hypothetical protein
LPALRVNDLLPDSRLDQIEATVRRELPQLPDNAIFNTYVVPAGHVPHNGVLVPTPEIAEIAVMVPNPKWPEKEPQFRAVKARRSMAHFRHFEQQAKRLVNAPDVALMDFRAAAKKAVEVYEYQRDLLN